MATGDRIYIASKGYVDQLYNELNSKLDLAVIDTQSGSFVQSTIADDCVVEVTIEGKTVVTPLDPTKDISPDNPATITSVGDEPFDVVSCGKNIFDGMLELGTIDVETGKNANATTEIRSVNYIPVLPNTDYTISRSAAIGTLAIRLYDKDKNYLGAGNGIYNLSGYYKTINIKDSNVRYIRFKDMTSDLSTRYQIELGTVATSLESYKSNKITISLPLRSISNSDTLGDTLEIFTNKTAKYTRRVKRAVITDSSDIKNVVEQDANNIRFQVQLESYNTSKASSVTIMLPAMSDKLELMNVENSSLLTANTFNVRQHRDWAGIRAVICIPKNYLSSYDVEGVKTWLNSNPITILYYFVTPIRPAIEEIVYFDSVLMSYKGTTNIYTTDPLQPNLIAKFYSRLGNFAEVIMARLDQLTQALLALGGTV